MAQIATSIVQSKKLLELGINPKTADMYYYCQSKYDLRIGSYKAVDKEFDIPAWSLTALLTLLPAPINMNTNFAYPHIDVFNNIISYIVGMAVYKEVKGHDLFDAAVEMIEWLANNGYIKKEE